MIGSILDNCTGTTELTNWLIMFIMEQQQATAAIERAARAEKIEIHAQFQEHKTQLKDLINRLHIMDPLWN